MGGSGRAPGGESQLDPVVWARAKAVFHRAVSMSPEERLRHLDEIGADEPEADGALESDVEPENAAGSGGVPEPAEDVEPSASGEPGMPTDAELGPDSLVQGRYRVLQLLARGRTSVICSAHDVRLQRRVVLKFLSPLQSYFFRFLRGKSIQN